MEELRPELMEAFNEVCDCGTYNHVVYNMSKFSYSIVLCCVVLCCVVLCCVVLCCVVCTDTLNYMSLCADYIFHLSYHSYCIHGPSLHLTLCHSLNIGFSVLWLRV